MLPVKCSVTKNIIHHARNQLNEIIPDNMNNLDGQFLMLDSLKDFSSKSVRHKDVNKISPSIYSKLQIYCFKRSIQNTFSINWIFTGLFYTQTS